MWRWEKDSDNTGLYYYSIYYFHSRRYFLHSVIVDSPNSYDIYHNVFKGRATYADYLRAIDSQFEDARLKIKDIFHRAFILQLRLHLLLIFYGSLALGLLFWSVIPVPHFILGVLIYLVVRLIKYKIQTESANAIIESLIVDEAIKKYKKNNKNRK